MRQQQELTATPVPQCWLAAVHEALQPPRMQHLQLIKHIPIRASNPSKGVTVGGVIEAAVALSCAGGFFTGLPQGHCASPRVFPLPLFLSPPPQGDLGVGACHRLQALNKALCLSPSLCTSPQVFV